MSQRLSDDDVDRIASQMMKRAGLANALVIVAILFFGPAIIFPMLIATQSFTRGMPAPVAVAIMAAVIAVPVIVYILVWGRRLTR